jgi:hypothetical protein
LIAELHEQLSATAALTSVHLPPPAITDVHAKGSCIRKPI